MNLTNNVFVNVYCVGCGEKHERYGLGMYIMKVYVLYMIDVETGPPKEPHR